MATEQENKSITQIIYGLYAASYVVPVTWIAAIILNYAKQADVAGTMYESHFRWQIRTFWFWVVWVIVGAVLFPAFGLGILVWIASGIWCIYRIVIGWLRLTEGKAMYA